MEVEKTNSFLSNLKEKLEEQLNESVKKNKAEIKKLVTEELAEIEKRNEKKFKNLYYWLFSIFLVLLIIIIGVFFYLKNKFFSQQFKRKVGGTIEWICKKK